MNRPRPRQQGFTLIELLVALTISGMLLALVSQAFYLITRQWETRFSAQEAALDLAARQFLVNRALEGTVPFIAPESAANQQRTPLVKGLERSFEWVTASPVWHQPPALAVLAVTEQEGGDGARWVYRERPIGSAFGMGRTEASQATEGQTLILWPDNGERFQYFGYLSLNARLGGTGSALGGAEWSERYTGRETGQIPMAVRLSNKDGRVLSVDIPTNSLGYLQGSEF